MRYLGLLNNEKDHLNSTCAITFTISAEEYLGLNHMFTFHARLEGR